jgi:structural maintenance of chromosome 3 (chondroitin sulfate proteoglycan 6)
MCVSKRETYTRKIAELGSLPPPSELERFTNKSIHDLMKSLDSVNKQLKKYSHVNKKAFDQYVNFNEQREQLLARKEELDKEAEKVNELIESLDQQKDEAINRTFRGASSHFKDVFSELVPNGAGELTMRTAIDDDDDDEEEDDDDAQSPKKKTKTISDPSNPDVSLYRGIGIKVRFSQVGENYIMSQLSGGQKALVAMALIFAIQRCDPAPFYLFDELDQALDSTYRAAVARMIKKQANNKENPTQFIVSTFRPELVEAANQCYGISLQNKVSSVHALPKKDALRFIADLMHDEEAVGEVTTVATSKGSTLGARKRKAVAQVEYNDDSEGGDGLEVEYDDQ